VRVSPLFLPGGKLVIDVLITQTHCCGLAPRGLKQHGEEVIAGGWADHVLDQFGDRRQPMGSAKASAVASSTGICTITVLIQPSTGAMPHCPGFQERAGHTAKLLSRR